MQTKEDHSSRKRASASKSRAGCSTCKRRRVKCDEKKPNCLRCLKANVPCEGYMYSRVSTSTKTPPAVTDARKVSKPTLLPKSDAVTHLSTARPTLTLPGETEVENRYLKYFHQETTSGFQSAYDWTLWNRIVLQGCHHEPFMRYAVVAIGALHKSLRILSSTGQAPLTKDSEEMAMLHREFAYMTYGKALKKMQEAIDTGADHGPRNALYACLLIVCFESHTGNRYKALVHAKYGLQILQQWVNDDASKSRRKRKLAIASPSPIEVEDQLVEAFRNLDIQITTVNDRRTVMEHEKSIEQDSFIVESMPSCFDSLETARMYYNVIMRRSCHFMATTWSRTEPELLTRPFGTNIPGSVDITVGDTIHTTAFRVDNVVRTGQKRFMIECSHWLEVFRPISLRIRQTSTMFSREYVIATMLQIQALILKITLAGVVFTQEILYDEYLPEFTEVIRLSHDVAKACHLNADADFWAGSFLLDLGLTVPLFTLLLRCRNSVLRRQAIEILEKWHVECWWDPLLIIAIGHFIMEVEEEGMVDGFIPEEARAILTRKSHCPPQRGMLLQCVQRTGGSGRGLKWTERYVRW